jgi:membrane-bound lytic murein transglycosylase B
MVKKLLACVICALGLCAVPQAHAQQTSFDAWLQDLAMEAAHNGISAQTIQRALSGLAVDESVIELDQKQPETTITFESYEKNILTSRRIDKGSDLLEENRPLLREISARYGVPSSIIVALWGVESSYGHNSGSYNVIGSLATLAYQGRRAGFFRKELMDALRLIDEEHIDPSVLMGSWAGAMGQSQFMPSTFRRYAVDYDRDGHRDIWNTEADIFASIANYLVSEGWQAGQSWGREVRLAKPVAPDEFGLENRHSLAMWNQMGVRTLGHKALPKSAQAASLIQPDGPGGRAFLVYDNFRALMRWNHSTYFATSVGLLADQIAAR